MIDAELLAFFKFLGEPDEDVRLAKMAERLNSEEFAVPDSTGYSGDVVAELELADLLTATTGMESADASNVVNEIVRCRKARTTKTSTRRQRVEAIINKTLRCTSHVQQLEKLARAEDWSDELESRFQSLEDSVVTWVENAVQEARV